MYILEGEQRTCLTEGSNLRIHFPPVSFLLDFCVKKTAFWMRLLLLRLMGGGAQAQARTPHW